MSPLSSLPQSTFVEILCGWLDVAVVVKLDGCIPKSAQDKKFLTSCYNCSSFDFTLDKLNLGALKWLQKNEIFLKRLSFDGGTGFEDIVNFLPLFEKVTVLSLSIHQASSQASQLLNACGSLQELSLTLSPIVETPTPLNFDEEIEYDGDLVIELKHSSIRAMTLQIVRETDSRVIQRLEKLHVSAVGGNEDSVFQDCLLPLASLCCDGNLKALEFNHFSLIPIRRRNPRIEIVPVPWVDLGRVLKSNGQMTDLNFYMVETGFFEPVVLKLIASHSSPALRRINIQHMTKLPLGDVAEVLVACPMVEKLNLLTSRGQQHVDYNCNKKVSSNKTISFQNLEVSGESDEFGDFFSRTGGFTEISFRSCATGIISVSLSKACPALRKLTTHSHQFISGDIANLLSYKHEKLEFLSLICCDVESLSGEQLLKMLTPVNKVTTLELHNLDCLTFDLLLSIVTNNAQLTQLELSGKREKDRMLAEFVKRCVTQFPALRVIHKAN